MIRLSDQEWAVLVKMARSLYANAEKYEGGYWWTVGDTLIESEVELLKKLSQYEPTKRDGLFLKNIND